MMAEPIPGNFTGTGHTPVYPPYVSYGQGSGPGGSGPGSPGNRNRNVIIGVVSLLVVGGLIAALIVLLGGGDDDKASTAGSLSDPASGVSIPRFKGWDVPKASTRPTHQVIGRIPCDEASSGAPSDSPSDGPSDDPSDSSDEDDCYLGEIEVITFPDESFGELVENIQKLVEEDDSGDKILNTEKTEAIKVKDKNAHLLVYKVEEAKAVGGSKRVYFVQYVLVDAPVDGEYPIVAAQVYDLPNAPSKATLDSVRNGIEIGQPQPSESAS